MSFDCSEGVRADTKPAAGAGGLRELAGAAGEGEPQANPGCAMSIDGEAKNHSSFLYRPALTSDHHFKREVLLGSDFERLGFRISLLFPL